MKQMLLAFFAIIAISKIGMPQAKQFQAWGKVGFNSSAVPADMKEIPYDYKRGFEFRFRAAGIGFWYILEPFERDLYPMSDADRQRGYVLFINNYLDQIYPTVPPRRDQVRKTLKIFATPGEYEPATFSVYSLRDISQVQVLVGDLTGNGGTKVSNENIDIRMVRALRKRVDPDSKLPQNTRQPSQYESLKTYLSFPHLLEQRSAVDIPTGRTLEYWLTCYVPENTKPGKYTAAVTFRPGNASADELTLELEVLPFKLESPPLMYSMNYSGFNKETEQKTQYFFPYTNARKELADMKEHGLTNVLFSPKILLTPDGHIDPAATVRQLEEVFAAVRQAGFGREILFTDTFAPLKVNGREGPGGDFRPFSEQLDGEYVALIKAIDDCARDKYGLEAYFEHCNEAPTHDSVDVAIHYNRLLKERLPNTKTHSNLDAPVISHGKYAGQQSYDLLGRWLDMQTFATAPPELVARVKGDGKRYTVKNGGGYGGSAVISRLWAGFYLAKTKVDGMKQWQYSSARFYENPYDNFDVHEVATMYAFPASDGPIPTRAWEGMREGIDDARYIYTLRQTIKRAMAQGGVAARRDAEEAETYLDSLLREAISYDFRSEDPSFGVAQRKAYYERSFLDLWRWEIAKRIVSIRREMEGSRTAGMSGAGRH
jgi:hypothetical protein